MKELTRLERAALLASSKYRPARLLNHLAAELGTNTDAALAVRLDLNGSQVCNIRHKRYPLTPSVIVSILDSTELTIKQLRQLAGMPVAKKPKRRVV